VIAVIPVLVEEPSASRGRVKRLVGALIGSTAVLAALSTFLR
jgi:hypothetical protein